MMDESSPKILGAGTIKFWSKLFANRMYHWCSPSWPECV